MTTRTRHRVWRALLIAVGGLGGLIVATIAILNLHILVGLEEGYAASPRQVWDFSGVLAVLDVGLLVAGPVLGALALWMIFRPVAGRP